MDKILIIKISGEDAGEFASRVDSLARIQEHSMNEDEGKEVKSRISCFDHVQLW